MKDLALRALDAAARRGVTYADVRAMEARDREIATKNGKAGHVSSAESLGVGIRVLAYGCWGFAATDDLTASGIEAARRWLSRSRARARRRASTKWCWRRKKSTRRCGSRPCASTRSRCRWIATWRCCWRWTRNCGTTPGSAWPKLRCISSAAAGLRLHAGQPDRPDALPVGRGFFGAVLQRRRDSEALVPELLRRPVPVEGLRAGGRAAPGGERAADGRRGGGAARRRPVPRGRIRPDPGQLAARACRFTNRSGTPSSWTACWAAKPITRA